MKSDDFNNVIEAQIERSTSVLINKAAEYASDDDRLHNFKVAASMQGCTPAQALAGMMAKHTTSIFDMIRSGQSYTTAMWNEKITDHINYLLLLRALVEEEFNRIDEQEKLDEANSKIDYWDIPRYNRRDRIRVPALDETADKAIEDQTALNDIAAIFADEDEDDKLQRIFDIVDKVRVTDPDADSLRIDMEDSSQQLYLAREGSKMGAEIAKRMNFADKVALDKLSRVIPSNNEWTPEHIDSVTNIVKGVRNIVSNPLSDSEVLDEITDILNSTSSRTITTKAIADSILKSILKVRTLNKESE